MNAGDKWSQEPPETGALSRLVGNRVTEKDIRDQLDRRGFDGKSARFREIELHAIRRPGWQQVFRFRCTVNDSRGERLQLFGAVFDDERERTEVWWSREVEEQQQRLAEWSVDMLRCTTTDRNVVHWLLLALFGCAVLVAITGWVIRQLG